MRIKREINEQLIQWKNSFDRKPLIIQGSRQIGKTWIMKEFGKQNFKHTAYFNFEENSELKLVFEATKSIDRILSQLVFFTNQAIIPNETLLIFDEIQECNKALNSLKYFCEDAPEYAIVAAGSLLGVSMQKGDSFPVGKVDFLQMYPIGFKEFLAHDQEDLHNFLKNINSLDPLPLIVLNRLNESLRRYFLSGGMPKVVSDFLDNRGIEKLEKNLNDILIAYSLDFAKHAASKDIPKITEIWNSIPSQLSRENRKFLYKLVKQGARAREYEDALLWLQHAGLIYRVFSNTKPHLPLSAYDDLSAFKIYMSDVGLLRKIAKLPSEIIINDSPIYTEFKGAYTENYILQSLITQFELKPRYWTSQGKAEIDFLIQHKSEVIPIEVKSAYSITGKSLHIYDQTYNPKLRIRYSHNNLKKDGNLLNIPLALADYTKKLVESL